MKKYFFPVIIYLIIYGLSVPFILFLKPYFSSDIVSIIHKTVLGILFLLLIYKYVNTAKDIFKRPKFRIALGVLTTFLFLLFAINNYFMSNYSIDYSYLSPKETILIWMVVAITISSIVEEIMYRGFVQSYVNQVVSSNNRLLTKGNLLATALMIPSHIGFYTIMDPLFATTSLALLVIFSLSVGYIRDESKGLVLPILIHVLCNYIHVIFHLHHFE